MEAWQWISKDRVQGMDHQDVPFRPYSVCLGGLKHCNTPRESVRKSLDATLFQSWSECLLHEHLGMGNLWQCVPIGQVVRGKSLERDQCMGQWSLWNCYWD